MAAARASSSVRRVTERLRVGLHAELPVIVLDATRRGATVAVTANVHGDEVTGLAAVHQLADRLQGVLRRGRVLLYPSLNPTGLRQQLRALPDDGVDLNRAFPGDARGTGASLVAHRIWEDLRRREPAALIDLHADSASAIPYAIVDRAVRLRGARRQEMDAQLNAMADASGLTVLQEYPDELYVRFRLDRSLAGAMVNHAGVPAVTLEVGPRRVIDPQAVEVAVEAVLRLLAHLGLLNAGDVEGEPPRLDGGPWRRSAAPRVQRCGLFVPELEPGAAFGPGDLLGTVRDVDGSVLEQVRAEGAGVVVSWAESAWIEPRGVPGTLGLEEGWPPSSR